MEPPVPVSYENTKLNVTQTSEVFFLSLVDLSRRSALDRKNLTLMAHNITTPSAIIRHCMSARIGGAADLLYGIR